MLLVPIPLASPAGHCSSQAAGYDKPIFIHGALQKLQLYQDHGVPLGTLEAATSGEKGMPQPALAGQIVIAPPSAIADRWSRRLPDPLIIMASGGCR